MHELDRIKKALRATPERSLKTIMLEAGCDYTRAAITALLPEGTGAAETPTSRALLVERLERLEVNPFLIDPVPGDTAYMLPYIGWHNDLFYRETTLFSS